MTVLHLETQICFYFANRSRMFISCMDVAILRRLEAILNTHKYGMRCQFDTTDKHVQISLIPCSCTITILKYIVIFGLI